MNPENKFNEALEKIKSFESDLWPTNIDNEEPKTSLTSKNDENERFKILYSPNIMVYISDECIACSA
jgi:hypothetical protein